MGRLSLIKQHQVMFLAWLPYSQGSLNQDGTFYSSATVEKSATQSAKGTLRAVRPQRILYILYPLTLLGQIKKCCFALLSRCTWYQRHQGSIGCLLQLCSSNTLLFQRQIGGASKRNAFPCSHSLLSWQPLNYWTGSSRPFSGFSGSVPYLSHLHSIPCCRSHHVCSTSHSLVRGEGDQEAHTVLWMAVHCAGVGEWPHTATPVLWHWWSQSALCCAEAGKDQISVVTWIQQVTCKLVAFYKLLCGCCQYEGHVCCTKN